MQRNSNVRLMNGIDQLWEAISEASGLNELQEFLAAGGDPNERPKGQRWSLVHLAVEHGNLELLAALAEAGADMDAASSDDGWRPLHLAVDADIDGPWQATNSPWKESRSLRLLRYWSEVPIPTPKTAWV